MLDEPPRYMGEGFVLMSSNDLELYFYMDEPGLVPEEPVLITLANGDIGKQLNVIIRIYTELLLLKLFLGRRIHVNECLPKLYQNTACSNQNTDRKSYNDSDHFT